MTPPAGSALEPPTETLRCAVTASTSDDRGTDADARTWTRPRALPSTRAVTEIVFARSGASRLTVQQCRPFLTRARALERTNASSAGIRSQTRTPRSRVAVRLSARRR